MFKRHVFHLSLRPRRRSAGQYKARKHIDIATAATASLENLNEPLLSIEEDFGDEDDDDNENEIGRYPGTITRVRLFFFFEFHD
ncbi:unnamed protein product [Gongylonema pulchrum]|uniref:Uncharacterized protein n=1 Tax=Gongylonema pulchrum TaxID=637853 RepID=A0A183D7V4_9BILA|nr:unnamed protein product [Gongylonema pulchrum]